MARTKAQIRRETGLSAADVEYLWQLRFRRSCEPGPGWAYRQPRNRWGLLVPTMMGHYERHPRFARNGRSLARLESTGWIAYGPDGYLPSPFDREYGSTVRLTEKALAVLDGEIDG